MSTRPTPQRTRRNTVFARGRGASLGLLAAGAAGMVGLLEGCFFPLADLELAAQGGSGGGAGPTGGGGSSVGGSGLIDTGGTGGSDVTPACPSGQKRCGNGQCQPRTPEFGCGSADCTPCGEVAQADVTCSELGQCVATCNEGFADCNGDVIGDTGPIEGDGCEFQFAPVSPSPNEMPVPFRASIVPNGEADDWIGIPAYAFEATCANCQDDHTAPLTEDATFPQRDDLEAYFRVAWNNDFVFVIQDVFDPDLLDDSSRVPTCGERGGGAAVCEDGFQIFFDGRADVRDNYFSDNIRLLAGLSNRVYAPAQGPPASQLVTVVSKPWAPACYRIEARFDWKYITFSLNGNEAPPGQFPPLAGQRYGFDIAVNDWDPSIADASIFERQSQVFWRDPGPNFASTTAGLPLMVLQGGPDAGAP